jgi:zinc transport system ATP-binding protein
MNTPADPLATNDVLAAADLTVERGGLPVVRGIDLRVGHGEAVALMGGNGSGKSTLVLALLRLIPWQRGTVRLFGTPLSQFRDWSRIGYVPQHSTVTQSAAKVKEVVSAGRLAHRTPFVPLRAADRAAIAEALTAVGMQDRASHQMTRLSGGQQQRVLIARALAGQPDLLVLDEPTAGVDLAHQRILADLLAGLVRNGTSALVVLHEVGPLRDVIDRAVVLHEGRVIHDGPLGNLGEHHQGRHEQEESTVDSSWLGGAVEP